MKPLRIAVLLFAILATRTQLLAETHRLAPTVFVNTYSAAHTPVLHIKSGDRLITSVVDDMGVNGQGQTVAQGPNPQTGPFFIEGAEPGDLLVVTIVTLTPNRASGSSAATMAVDAVEPGSLSGKRDSTRVPWTIDTAKRLVRFDLETLGGTGWRSRFVSPVFEMPLAPTLASISVAPAGQDAVSTTTAGRFGGNLMAAGITAGASVMLPVLQPGALLFLGHGHARQGDGGVTGTGIETSLDVELTVDVVKKKEWPHSSVVRPSTVVGEFDILWPRIETAEHLMAVGGGKTLLEALQHATLELHHWLDDDFGLSERAVNIFVGQAIEYEVANIADATFTVVAKTRKSYLPKPVATP
jgi:acetamidase/formamidase